MTLLAEARTKAPKSTVVPENNQADVKLSDSEKNTVIGMVASEQSTPTVPGASPSERRAWSAASVQRD